MSETVKPLTERYNVIWYDVEGNEHYEFVAPTDDGERIGSAIQRLTQGPAAKMGIIKRVTITDMGDCCNFEWIDGKVTFPSKGDA